MAHAVNWFEIPVNDFDRAKTFYQQIFAIDLFVPEGAGQVAMFPSNWQEGEIGGSLTTQGEPSDKGTVVFLNGGDDLAKVLDRVEGAGGKVVLPKTKIPMGDAGFMALFMDTEGNKVGLHSMG